jgi:hypothetical protein
MLRFFSFLLCLALVVLIVVAFTRGWVNVSVFNKEDRNESGAAVTIDKNKIKDDVAAAKQKVNSTLKSDASKPDEGKADDRKPDDGKPAGKQQSQIEGKVKKVGASDLVLTTETDKSLELKVARETEIRIGNEKGTLKDFRPGDHVTASYVTVDNQRVATSLRRD